MKPVSILRFCGALALLGSVTAQAGSERWIMRISVPEMAAEGLVHVRLADAAGTPVESGELKAMIVHGGDCQTGAALSIPEHYKFGFFPKGRVMGLFLRPATWKGKSLCFDLPGKGVVNVNIPDGSAGQSIALTLSAGAAPVSGAQLAAKQ